MNKSLPLVSVVVIAYKRFDLLKRTIEAFQSNCTYPNIEYILTDDGSSKEIQEKMLTLPFDEFLLGKKNRGLGHNTNKGILAANGEYIFHLQDGFCLDTTNYQKNFIEVALEVFEERPDIYLLRYWYSKSMRRITPKAFYLYTTNSGVKVKILDMKLAFPDGKYPKEVAYAYSDNPHIKRRSFHEKLGLYKENVRMANVEIDFCRRFERQTEMNLGCLVEFSDVFRHRGEEQSFKQGEPEKFRPFHDSAPIKFLDKKIK